MNISPMERMKGEKKKEEVKQNKTRYYVKVLRKGGELGKVSTSNVTEYLKPGRVF